MAIHWIKVQKVSASVQNCFNLKDILLFTCGFILFTAIGTISHEYGHILMAESLGYDTALHFDHMLYHQSEQIEQEVGADQVERDELSILLAGPASTLLISLIGLTLLFFRKKKHTKSAFQFPDWMAVFLALFCLRSVFNLFMSIIQGLYFDAPSFFGGDELRISKLLNYWEGTVPIFTAVICALIAFGVLFQLIPAKHRINFILAGLIGGSSGYVLWMKLIGPIVLP